MSDGSKREGSSSFRVAGSAASSGHDGPRLMNFEPGDATGNVVDKQVLIDELATLGDVTEDEAIYHLFQILASPPAFTVVDLDNAARILEVVGVAFEEITYMDVVGSQTELSYDQLKEVANQLKALTASTKDDADANQEREVEIISLGVFDYFIKKITCQKPAPGTMYKLVGPSLELKPRQVLVSLMGAATLFCCGLVIMTVALLWIDYADSDIRAGLKRFGSTTKLFCDDFERVMIVANGNQLSDTAIVISEYGSSIYFLATEGNRSQFGRDTSILSIGLTKMGNVSVGSQISTARNLLLLVAALPSRFQSTGFAALRSRWPKIVLSEWNVTNQSTTARSQIACLGSACLQYMPCWSSQSTTILQQTFAPLGTSASAIGTPLPSGTVLCASISWLDQTQAGEARVAGLAISLLSAANHFNNFAIAKVASDLSVTWLYSSTSASACFSSTCTAEATLAVSSVTTRKVVSLYDMDRTGTNAVMAARSFGFNVAFLEKQSLATLRSTFVNTRYQDLIYTLNYIRAVVQGSTIEVVIMTHNYTSGLSAQLEPPSLETGCYGVCRRSQYALANADTAFRTHGIGWSITPDYRPEPCVGGFSYDPEATTDTAIVIERDVTEVRRLASISLGDLISKINAIASQSLEVLFFHRYNDRLTKMYDPTEACPLTANCLVYAVYGVVYRSDCSHCSRPFSGHYTDIEYLSPIKLSSDCAARGRNCSLANLATDQTSISRIALDRTDEFVETSTTDYRGVTVGAYVGYVTNFTANIVVKQDLSDVTTPINQAIYISLGACAGFIFVVTFLFVLLAQRLLEKIEEEWLKYKLLIAKERKEFTESVREMMPPYIAERITQSQKIQGEHQTVCVAFIDMCGSTLRNSLYDPNMFARFMTYTLHMMDSFAHHYAVHRVRFIGDVSMFVSGLNETGGDSSGIDHYTLRMMRCLLNICQISGSRYAHYPHRCELFADVFGAEPSQMPDLVGEAQHVGTMMMPQTSIGVHQGGVTVSLLFFPNGAPHFDVISPTVALAHRLSQSAKAGGIMVSDSVRDVCQRHAPPGMIEFGKQRKIVIRGRGTANTSEVKSALVPVPAAVFQPLGVRYSRLRKYFDEDELKKAEGRQSGSETSSIMSHSDISSAKGSDR